MKWKKLYSLSLHLIEMVLLSWAGLNAGIAGVKAVRGMADDIPDSVSVEFRPYTGGNIGGAYSPSMDKITVFYNAGLGDKNGSETLIHELKHADNARKFPVLNVNADELSAYLTRHLYTMTKNYKIQTAERQLKKDLPKSAFVSPMDSLIEKRLPKGVKDDFEYGLAKIKILETLRQEKETLIDSIFHRFQGAIADSLIHQIEQKYNETSHFETQWQKIVKETVFDLSNIKETTKKYARDWKYKLPDLNQSDIDSLFTEALKTYRPEHIAYISERAFSLLGSNLNVLSDAELEDLFTYNINGQHRSLFREASPEIKKQVRRMANMDNLEFMTRQSLGRE